MVERGARGRVDAHVAHGTGDDEMLCARGAEPRLEVGRAERVGEVLLDDRFAGTGRHRRVDLGAGRSAQEERRARANRQVAHVNDRQPALPERGE